VVKILQGDTEIDTDDPNYAAPSRLYDAVTGGFVEANLGDPASVFSAIQRLIGRPPTSPEIDPNESAIKQIMVQSCGPGGPETDTVLMIDPLPGQRLDAEAQEYNSRATLYAARMNALVGQFAALLQHKDAKPAGSPGPKGVSK